MKWDAGLYDSTQGGRINAGTDLMEMAGIKNTDSILDIGCGTGTFTVELARRADRGFVVGIDPSPEMLEKAKEKSASAKNMALMLIAAQDMDFTDRFDLVFSNLALQWVKEQKGTTMLVHKALKQLGRIAFQIPAIDFCPEFFENINSALAERKLERFYSDGKYPWYFPAKEEYEDMLVMAGFRNVRVFYKCYQSVFESTGEVLKWLMSAGLRPYLSALPAREQEYFKYAVAMRFENSRTDNGIELNFRRLFAFAEK